MMPARGTEDRDILDALNAIPVADLTRAEWVSVGMALKDKGFECGVWDNWSRADSRYHPGECERIWAGFRGSGKPVTGGTIIQMAKDRGWAPDTASHNYGWDDIIENDGEPLTEFVPKQQDLPPREQLKKYLQTLYSREDIVDLVTNEAFRDEDGKWKPKAGHAVQVGVLLQALDHYKDEDAVENSIGTTIPDAGAWIRVNAMDGHGHGNASVASLRYALVESDTLPVSEQRTRITQMQLPVATLVDSGGKSLHALVKIEARDEEQYRERVRCLFQYLKDNGFPVDEQNKNPSRLTRLPGVRRGDRMQTLLAVDMGKPTWEAWEKWSRGEEEKLPAIVPFEYYIEHPPVLRQELIKGLLRRGHKMTIGGPSKAGKSFAMQQLCVAIASGKTWFGCECEKGRIVYINMELDDQSCAKRFLDIRERMGVSADELRGNLFMWHLRGCGVTMDEMLPDVIHMIRDIRPVAVCFDPIYKITNGDENSAADMGKFTSQLDRIAKEVDASVIISHHYAKGQSGAKDPKDRLSGSGVFARDADALVLIDQLERSELFKRQHNGDERTPWRVSTVLREFKEPAPWDVWFDYPIHVVDRDGELSKLHIAGEALTNETRSADAKAERDDKLWMAYCHAESHDVTDMARYLNIGRSAVYNKVRASGGDYIIRKGRVYNREDAADAPFAGDE